MAGSVLSILVKFAALDKLTGPLRAMGGAGKATAKDIAATRKEVLGLEKQAAQIGAFKDQASAIAKSHRELDAARKRVTALRAAIQQADGPTGRLTRSLEAATGKVARLDNGLQKQVTRLGDLRTGLSGAGIDVNRLGEAERRLADGIGAANRRLDEQREKQDRAAASTRRMEAAQRFGDRLKSGGTRGLAVAAAVEAPVVFSIKSAIDAESAFADLRKVFSGTPDELARVRSQILGMTRELPLAATELFQMTAQAKAAGVANEDLTKFTRSATQMAVAFDMLPEDAGRTMATWRTAFKLTQGEAIGLGDQVNALTNSYGGNSAAVAEIISRMGPLGKVAGLASGQLAAAAQLLNAVGVQEEIAGTGLKNLALGLTKGEAATKAQKKAYDALGLSAATVAKNMQIDSGATIIDVLTRISKLPKAQQVTSLDQLFGSESIAAIAPLLTNLDQLKRNFAFVGDKSKYSGSMVGEFSNRMDTSANKLALAANASKELQIELGGGLLPTVNSVSKKFQTLTNMTSDWARGNPVAAQGIAMVVAAGGLLIGLFSALAIGLGFVGPAFLRGAGYIAKLGPVLRFLLSPIQLVIRGLLIGLGAIAAFVGLPVWLVGAIAVGIGLAALAIYNHWGTISRGASTLWTGLTGAFNGGLAFLRGLVPSFSQIGHALLQGLLLALNPAALVQHVIRLGGVIVGALRNVLGIKSPSRVFAAIGGHMMAGLTMGLDGGVDGPMQRLRRAGAQLAGVTALSIAPNAAVAVQPVAPINAPAPPPGGGGSGGPPRPPSSGDTYHFTINAGPGVDAEEVADRVIKKIDDRQRANQRSSYQDDA